MAKKRGSDHNWVKTVKTDTVNTPKGVMKRTPKGIAATLIRANPGLPIGALIRFIIYFLNRGGKGISKERRQAAEEAMAMLQKLNEHHREEVKKLERPSSRKLEAMFGRVVHKTEKSVVRCLEKNGHLHVHVNKLKDGVEQISAGYVPGRNMLVYKIK